MYLLYFISRFESADYGLVKVSMAFRGEFFSELSYYEESYLMIESSIAVSCCFSSCYKDSKTPSANPLSCLIKLSACSLLIKLAKRRLPFFVYISIALSIK